MGNASGGNDGEGPSGTKKLEGNYGGVYLETSPSDHGVFSEPMEAHPPPNSPRSYQSNLLFAPHHVSFSLESTCWMFQSDFLI